MKENNIMIKTILFITVSMICWNAYSQSNYRSPWPSGGNLGLTEVVDSGNIRVYYALNALDISNSKTYDDYQRLEIGSNSSMYYSDFIWTADSINTENNKTGANRYGGGIGGIVGTYYGKEKYWFEYQYSEYFKDFSTNKLTEYSRMPAYMQRQNCKSEEDIPVQEWVLHDDTLSVVGYICQKATCHFRGRNYTAWFAADIPVSNGPWKFGGLPGLILKVSDDDKFWIFECTSVKKYEKKFPILLRVGYKKFPRMERSKLLKLHDLIHKDYLRAAGLIVPAESPESNQKNTHVPLELE
jgi:GLPGLI family protein